MNIKTVLIIELDTVFSGIIRSRGVCKRCGQKDNLVTAHIFSRRNLSVRWDFGNAFCFCTGCHAWAHQNPKLFKEFVKSKLGDEFKVLEKKAMQVKKWSVTELEILLEGLKKI
ncbi:hypothetical protein ES705_31059 [subsurface metagenome]